MKFGLWKFLWPLVIFNFILFYQFITWNNDESDTSKVEPLNHCERNDYIVYMKTYKTASSTMVNLLYR